MIAGGSAGGDYGLPPDILVVLLSQKRATHARRLASPDLQLCVVSLHIYATQAVTVITCNGILVLISGVNVRTSGGPSIPAAQAFGRPT